MKNKTYYYSITTFCLLLCTSFLPTNAASKAPEADKISVMTFNVENLFDTKHDDKKLDYTFLPLQDKKSEEVQKYCSHLPNPKWKEECFGLNWDKATLKQKMKNIAQVVLQVNNGKGPDVLILQEVENESVLKEWINGYVKKAKYNSIILLEGTDERGIDVAIVTRLPVKNKPTLHPIPFVDMTEKGVKDTRGILEVALELPNEEELFVYANHFPAPFHDKKYRIQAFQFLEKIMKEKPADALQVAGGDFNTPGKEDREHSILDTYVAPSWIVAHRSYTGDKASSYYPKDKTWSFLDMLLVSKTLQDNAGWEWNPASFKIANQATGQVSSEGIPQSFEPRTGLGVSDHLPLYLEIESKK
jgi:endonuclease/exonuclease/phosphatase family metal-dependent hydrolase